MIDLHSHILPGIDDGPATLEGSLAFARVATAAGTTTIAATPHVNSRFQLGPDDLAALPERVRDLNAQLAEHEIPLKVVKGAEVSFSRVPELNREQLGVLSLGEGPCLLVESPYSGVLPMVEELLFSLQAKGVRPVLAHPERCPAFQADPRRVARLVEAGTVCLVNSGSISGSFGRAPRALALTLFREGLVHAVSSDSHDHEGRPPGLLEGLASAERELPGLSAEAERLTRDAPAAILAGGRVPAPPRLAARRRGGLGLLQRRR